MHDNSWPSVGPEIMGNDGVPPAWLRYLGEQNKNIKDAIKKLTEVSGEMKVFEVEKPGDDVLFSHEDAIKMPLSPDSSRLTPEPSTPERSTPEPPDDEHSSGPPTAGS